MRYLFWLWPEGTIPAETCDEWISRYKDEVDIGTVGGGNVNLDLRRSKTCFPTDLDVQDTLNRYIHSANRQAFGVDVNTYIECQFTMYEGTDEGCYGWHKDSLLGASKTMFDRKLTAVTLLSDPSDFVGGEFSLMQVDEQPEIGRGSVLVFPSFLVHQVAPVTQGTRFSMVAWAEGPHWR